jgi:hypothetical protein
MGQSANMDHFVAFVISFQDIVALKLPFWGKQGLLVIQKTTIYW